MLVQKVLGNVDDPRWRARSERSRLDRVRLNQWDVQKSRLRTASDDGADVAISLDRGVRLRDGDVLAWDEQGRMLVVQVDLGEVMVVELGGLPTDDLAELTRTAVELGHALGNQHWPAVIKGAQVYVPLTVDRKVMGSVMHTHALPGVTYRFVPGVEVIAYLAPHEERRLFGGADATPHSHAPVAAGQ